MEKIVQSAEVRSDSNRETVSIMVELIEVTAEMGADSENIVVLPPPGAQYSSMSCNWSRAQ